MMMMMLLLMMMTGGVLMLCVVQTRPRGCLVTTPSSTASTATGCKWCVGQGQAVMMMMTMTMTMMMMTMTMTMVTMVPDPALTSSTWGYDVGAFGADLATDRRVT
jgi:hypothetical protein